MTDGDRCIVMVGEPPGYWHDHPCGYKAKFTLVVQRDNWIAKYGTTVRVCGVHRKTYPFVDWPEATA